MLSNTRTIILYSHLHDAPFLSRYIRINKRGSQKDQEQKKSGNYFFYDADDGGNADDEDDDFDDI